MKSIDYALRYIARGWAVLPVWNIDELGTGECACGGKGSCKPGKHPIWELVPHGVKDASTDEATVREWFTRFPDANVAIATGQISGGLVIFDIDPRNGGSWSVLTAAFGPELEHSMIVKTGGGGWHVYTQAEGPVPGKGNIVPGIDIKGEGGYIIAPPSNHELGDVYAAQTAKGIEPCRTPHERLRELTGDSGAVSGDSTVSVPLDRSFDPHTAAVEREKALELFKASPRALKAYKRELEDIDDKSASGQDMVLANMAAREGWDGQEIAKLIANARRVNGDRPNGRSYYSSTAGAAIAAEEKRRGESLEPEDGETLPEIVVECMHSIAEIDIPDRETLIDPWLKERHLGLCFAKRGVGKTYFCLSVACAVATGTDLFGWKVPKARKVVYIDGEMDLADLRMRIAGILAGSESYLPRQNLNIISRDRMMSLGKRLKYIVDEDTREALLRAIPADTDLVVLDNLSCLVGGEENDAAAWDMVQDFILELRFRGTAVLMVHHAAKGGQQRGTSRREDVLDVSIRLESPYSDAEDDAGGAFKVVWEKRRGFSGSDCASFEAQLSIDEAGAVTWSTGAPDRTRNEVVAQAWRDYVDEHGKEPSVRQLAEITDLPKSSLHRAIKTLRSDGNLR